MKKSAKAGLILACLTVVALVLFVVTFRIKTSPEKIKVLILPKFEIGKMTGDAAGEAQEYYDGYVKGGKAYEIGEADPDGTVYVKDGVALYVTGMGKVESSLNFMNLLNDDRFDFSEAYILGTGCAGGAYEHCVMGDVYLITAAIDFDLGHHADARDLTDPDGGTWYHDESYDGSAYRLMNQELMAKVYDMIKDIPLETTERTRKAMAEVAGNAEWAARDPKVLRGTTVSSDNYWKGAYDHENALLMIKTYGAPDPYAISEMEDIAISVAADKMGMLDRLIIIRDVVNMDVYMNNATPEILWGSGSTLTAEDSAEALDLFPTAMSNNYKVGKVIIDAILDGKL